MTYDDQDVVVRDNPQAGRYELLVDGRLAGLATYVLSDGVMTILHAEVQPRFEGQVSARALPGSRSTTRAGADCSWSPGVRSSPPTSPAIPSSPT